MLINLEKTGMILVDVQEKLFPYVVHPEQLEKKCRWLLQIADRLKMPVLVSEQYSKGLGKTIAPLLECISNPETLEKVDFSAGRQEVCQQWLQHNNIRQVILIGIEAHVCVMQTAMDLLADGYEVYVVVDAVSSREAMDTKYALKRMENAGIHLVTSEMVLFECLERAGTELFKNMSREFLQNNK